MNADEITRRHLIENDLPEHILEPEMSESEKTALQRSADTLKKAIEQLSD